MNWMTHTILDVVCVVFGMLLIFASRDDNNMWKRVLIGALGLILIRFVPVFVK